MVVVCGRLSEQRLEVVERNILKVRNQYEESRGGEHVTFDKSKTTPLQHSVQAACQCFSLEVSCGEVCRLLLRSSVLE